ncbi:MULTISPECIES: Rv1733c family protein [unclassified Gordonia (in: high G+C Gram-positive bacteria)]
MAAHTTYRRFAAFYPWSTNPLMRRGDRHLARAGWSAVLVTVLAIPLCIWAATTTYDSVTARADRAIPASATVLSVVAADPTAIDTSATVSWRNADGTHTAITSVPHGTAEGSSIDIWTTADGSQLQQHAGPLERILGAVWVGILSWALVFAIMIGAVALVRRRVARAHADQWDREWRQAGNANGWAAH